MGRRLSLLCPIALVLMTVLCRPAFAREPLSLEDRLKAQEAIERVYYNHRIWPADNLAPRPPFESAVPLESIRARTEDGLRKCEALARFWSRPIDAVQLDAEVRRMVRDSQAPELLKELFAALGNDPGLIAECLARPILADRLLRNWYSFDRGIHADVRARASEAIGDFDRCETGGPSGIQRGRTRFALEGYEPGNGAISDHEVLPVDASELALRRSEATGTGAGAILRESAEGFKVIRTLSSSEQALEVEWIFFPKQDFGEWWAEVSRSLPASLPVELADVAVQPLSASDARLESTCQNSWESCALSNAITARMGHTAVWTGTEMIVWGGTIAGWTSWTGMRYSPATDSWSTVSHGTNCPARRLGHTAIWTGSEMLIWGGATSVGGGGYNTGARYNPTADSWTSMSVGTNCPAARSCHSAVWSGTQMVIWGGWSGSAPLGTGGVYTPSSDSWTATSTSSPCPTARKDHTAVWTDSEMIVWGGNTGTSGVNLGSGARYIPASDTWTALPEGAGCPEARSYHSAVWTGSEMILWGGLGDVELQSGWRFDPVASAWTATSTGPLCPAGRYAHTVVWAGSEMIVWGGWTGSTTFGDGARYAPASNSWTAMDHSGAPSARRSHTAVWANSEMIVWGGTGSDGTLRTGGRYSITSDSWVPTSTGPAGPAERARHTAVWTGSEMVVWGGIGEGPTLKTGGRYTPATDSWTLTESLGSCPAARADHTAVWTGSEMVVWGGTTGAVALASGGRYTPAADTWTPTSQGTNCAQASAGHLAVWTGTEMLVVAGTAYSGGRYTPASDSWALMSGYYYPPLKASAVWTGKEMIVWGGKDINGNSVNTGSRYDPATNTWTATSTGTNCPPARHGHAAVWTGTEMVIWGAYSITGYGYGWRYNPVSNAWVTNSTASPCPQSRYYATSVWTGREMIVWGGDLWGTDYYFQNSGGRYIPSLDDGSQNPWGAIPLTDPCPTARYQHTAVWTGERMLIWGGYPREAAGGSYYPGAAPIGIPAPTVADPDPCALNLTVSWPADPSDWNDSGEAGRGYLVKRDGSPIVAGSCAGFRSYGTTSCTDNSTAVGGSYTYSVEYFNGCGGKSLSSEVSISDLGHPTTPTISGAHTACEGATVTLSTESYATYQWFKDGLEISGATSQTCDVTASGSYSVRIGLADGCPYASSAFAVAFSPYPDPTLTGNSSGCYSVTLSTQSYSSYQWFLDGTPVPNPYGQNYYATVSGSYSVEVRNAAGCSATSPPKAVTVFPRPSPTITGNAHPCSLDEAILSTQYDPSWQYQWYNSSTPISGATSSAYAVTASGYYYVKVTDANACWSNSSVLAVTFEAYQPSAQMEESSALAADGPVNAMVRGGGNMYIGGSFNCVGKPVRGLVVVDAAQGAADQSWPLLAQSGAVTAMIPDGSGGFYIAGSFAQVGPVTVSNMAHILPGGQVDTAFAPTIQWSSINAMCLYDGALYLGGGFNSINGQERHYLAAVNATDGQLLAWNPSPNGTIYSMQEFGGTLYVSGTFNSVGGQSRQCMAALDPATGLAMPFNPNPNGIAYAMAFGPGLLYVGGSFATIAGQPRQNIAALDLVTGTPTGWNPGANGQVMALAFDGTSIYAGGSFTTIGGQPRGYLAALDPSTGIPTAWNPVLNGAVRSILKSGSTLYIVGSFHQVQGEARAYAAQLSLDTGALLPWNPSPNSYASLLVEAGAQIALGGDFTLVAAGRRPGLAAIEESSGLLSSWSPGQFQTVYCLDINGETLYVGGSFSSAGGAVRKNLAAVNTATGALLPWAPEANGAVNAIAFENGRIWAGGAFTSIGSQSAPYLATMDGTSGALSGWDVSADSAVMALAKAPGRIYAGGNFTMIKGIARSKLASIDASSGALTSWTPNPNSTVQTLLATSDTLYAGGTFTTIGGRARSRIAALQLDGSVNEWNPGANGTVRAISLSGGRLAVGGDFTTIGGTSRTRVAIFDTATGLTTAFNPAPDAAVNSISLSGNRVWVGGAFAYFRGWPHTSLAVARVDGVIPSCESLPVNLVAPAGFYSYQWLKDGSDVPGASGVEFTTTESGDYSVRVTTRWGCTPVSSPVTVAVSSPSPTVEGAPFGCTDPGSPLSTQSFSAYQWYVDGSPIEGATSQDYLATGSGSYGVEVRDAYDCMATSPPLAVDLLRTRHPGIEGDSQNTCPENSVILSCPSCASNFMHLHWSRDGVAIPGATGSSLEATLSGSYTLTGFGYNFCTGTSEPYPVAVNFCASTEVSPLGAPFQARLEQSSGSPTGYFLYFQKVSGVTGYSIYEGEIGNYYSHVSLACDPVIQNLGTGEMRVAITPSAGDRYYLVTAHDAGAEGPSGFSSEGEEIDPARNTCAP